MTRSFDVFDRDDFRTPDYDSERGMGSGSTSSWDKWRELQNIHREEERSDALSREAQQRSGRERPPVPREQRVRVVMEKRTRTAFTDRNRTHSLRDSEIYTMSEVGKFRVVAKNDLAELARFLAEQGMAKPYWPERLELVADMPRTPSGKIQKFKLREMAAKLKA